MSETPSLDTRHWFGFSSTHWRLMIALMFIQSLGYLPLALAPVYLSALVSEFGLTETQSGGLLTIEFLALALTLLAIGTVVNRFSLLKLTLAAGALLILGNGLSATATDATSAGFVVARVLCGCGSGLAMAVATAAVVRIAELDRAYGIVGAGSFTLGASLLALSGLVLADGGITYFFAFVAVVGAVFVVPSLMAWPSMGKILSTGIRVSRLLPHLKLGILYMVMVLLFGVTTNIAWTFSIQLGISSAMSMSDATFWAAANFYLGMPGNLLAGWLGLRYGRVPFFLGLIASMFSFWLLCSFQLPNTYILSQLVYGLAYGICIPYMSGLAAALDLQGRWVAITSGVYMFSNVISPLLGGFLLEVMSVLWFGYMLVAIMLVAIFLLWLVLKGLPAADSEKAPAPV